MKKEFLECGKICSPHGVRGVLKVEPWCDSPAVFAALPAVYLKENGAYRPVRVLRAAVLGGRFVSAELEGVTTMEQADALRARVLYAKRADLQIPEGVLLVAEMIGLPVYHADSGEVLGTLTDVIHPGASDIYVIATPHGEAMVPVVPEFVIDVSMEKGIAIRPIEGMLP